MDTMSTICRNDPRRDAVRRAHGRNGLDYVEVSDDQRTLYVYFLGKLPPELKENRPGLEDYLRIEGGRRVTDIRITDVDPQVNPDPEKDDYLVVRLDRYGDFSTYTLRLAGVENIDPHYDHVDFSFKVNCPSDLDCKLLCACEPPVLEEPEINYLAKDYASFRQLLLDRLALLMPDWRERHVPDLGITLVELLAYTADYLSYYQDAVATEAYLGTARQRISVRRHARLMDYRLHEGCNARAWVVIETSQDLELDTSEMGFITGLNAALPLQQAVLSSEELRLVPGDAYEFFEPWVLDGSGTVRLLTAHNEIQFHTWGGRECCLAKGATRATLLDAWRQEQAPPSEDPKPAAHDDCHHEVDSPAPQARALQLQPGDILIFEEVIGPKTGVAADANPRHRHAVRLTRVTPAEDPLSPGPVADGNATPYSTPVVEIEWGDEDALPFPLCLSAIGEPPDCRYLPKVSVARGNVLLADHGRTLPPEELGAVPKAATDAWCKCEGNPSDIVVVPGPFMPALAKTPLTFRHRIGAEVVSASRMLEQDVRHAMPQVSLSDHRSTAWAPQPDLLSSTPDDRHFVVEIDNDHIAHLRFGDGLLGCRPSAGLLFTGRYRVGLGVRGNVGAEAISRLVLRQTKLSGVSISVRNPLPAHGGTEPEPIEEAKLHAPSAFRKWIERAIIAEDYARLAERDWKVQRASAELVWTGSWYEADVAIDPWRSKRAEESLLEEIAGYLHRYRRIGHDLHVERAVCVPVDLGLEVCALPGHHRGQVKAALLDLFSNRLLLGGRHGWFHPDHQTFGEDIHLSRIIAAAQAVPGVECVRVTRLQRLFEPPNREIENGLLPLASFEIAQLDNDPNHPEHGRLEIIIRGGS